MVIVCIYAILRVYSRKDTHRSNPFAANGGRTDDTMAKRKMQWSAKHHTEN
jgi:hypothetical protein